MYLVFVLRRQRDVLDTTHRGLADDHVHLFTEYPPTVQFSKLASFLEADLSRPLRRCVVRTLREHLFSPPHLATSSGHATLSIVTARIQDQRRPEPCGYPEPGEPGAPHPQMRSLADPFCGPIRGPEIGSVGTLDVSSFLVAGASRLVRVGWRRSQ